MNRKEKRWFIRELSRNVTRDLIALVPEMPEEWDGHELRALIAEHFNDANFGQCSKAGARRNRSYRRLRAFHNECLVRGLYK